MGVVRREVLFEGRAPGSTIIGEAITNRCGLPVVVTESDATVKASLYDMHARLAFACAPRLGLEIFSYVPGAVRRVDDPATRQAVHLRAYVGEELTLFWVTALVLEQLGGRSTQPLSPEVVAEYGRALSPADLERRIRKSQRAALRVGVLGLLLLPVSLVVLAYQVLLVPWRIWRARRRLRNGTLR